MDKSALSALLREVRKAEKNKTGATKENTTVKIAVLGSCSIQYFVKILRYYLEKEGISPEIYEGEYDGINMDVFDASSKLYQFSPDYVILLPSYRDIKDRPALLADANTRNELMAGVKDYFIRLWTGLNHIPKVKILQGNLVIPPIRLLGNLEYQEPYAENDYYVRINEMLVREKPSNVTIVDLEALSSNIGKYEWFDYSAYFLNKAAVRLNYLPEYVMCFVRQIKALSAKVRKCLVLDLDNTLWGGVVGDDGWNGINLDPNNAVGEAYRFFQSYCLKLKDRGVILAICSKNDEEPAEEPFLKNENMILHLEDISCFVANWDNKADNLRRIAGELNIGLDSLVFFDDNPAERKIISQFLPEVMVIDVPEDPALFALEMEKEQPFDWIEITKEDLERTDSYRSNRERKELLDSFVDYDEYLKALEMKGSAGRVEAGDVARFTQLINKSNQFNLRTIRYQESDILKLLSSDEACLLYGKLSDRYSSYGIISCVILKKIGDSCFIDTWVMSCRVLKRGVEYMMLEAILATARSMGCESVRAEYIQTKKNKMVESFYESLGFSLTESGQNEGVLKKEYILNDLSIQPTYFIEKDV